MKKTILILFLLLLIVGSIKAQYVEKDKRQTKDSINVVKQEEKQKQEEAKSKTPVKQNPNQRMTLGERITFGGGLGGNFIGNNTSLNISPMVGYRFNTKFTMGVGGTYMYYSYKGSTYSYSTSIYAGRYYAMYLFIPQIFGYAEHELMNTEYYDVNDATYKRIWLSSPMVGIGLRQPIGNRAGLNFMVLYNLNYQKEYSPFPSPYQVRIGAMF